MKKHIITLVIIISPFMVFAQKYSNADKARISAQIDSLIQAYMAKNTLSEIPGLKKQNEKILKEYKKLFAADALIFDDMHPEFDEQIAMDKQAGKTKENPYKLSSKSKNDYFDELSRDFALGLLTNNKRINISYSNFDEGFVKVALERQIEGTNTKGLKLQNNDTLVLTISIKNKIVKISKVEALASNLKVMNDKDADGVTDDKDKCADVFGKITSGGCPEKEIVLAKVTPKQEAVVTKVEAPVVKPKPTPAPEVKPTPKPEAVVAKVEAPVVKPTPTKTVTPTPTPEVTPTPKPEVVIVKAEEKPVVKKVKDSTRVGNFVFAVALGPQFIKNTITMPGNFEQLGGYTSINKGASKMGEIVNPGIKLGFGFNASIAYYFGKKETNKSISIGVASMAYNANYQIQNAKYVFDGVDKSGDHYSRIVTLNQANEKLSYNIINIPVMFKYKGVLSQKWAYELGAGVSYMMVKTTSTYDYNISIEGIYNADYTYSPTDKLNNSTDLLIVNDNINGHMYNPNSPTLLSYLEANGYDFTYKKSVPIATVQVKPRNGVALNVGADLIYKIKPKWAVKFGVAYIYAANLKNKADDKNYKIIDKSDGSDFHSIYDSSAKSKLTAMGLNVGLMIGLK